MIQNYNYSNVILKEIEAPAIEYSQEVIMLSDETMQGRKNKILSLMKKKELDCIIVYCDLEHGSNFEYLTGFLTRFEESLLVLHADGRAFEILGNENLKMVQYSRIKAEKIHAPYFSLPNQPMDTSMNLKEILLQAQINNCQKIGVVGWKNFTSRLEDNSKLFDVPYFIVDALSQIVGLENMYNCADIFINSEYGARTTNNANEIAHYEYGAALASDCMIHAMNELEPGKSEMEIAGYLQTYGQTNNVITICAAGNRFEKANLYPTNKKIKQGDKLSLTVGYKGGLESRAGYVVTAASELSEEQQDYMEAVVAPYFTAVVAWLENIHIGMTGAEMYELVETILPKDKYHWSLNPGHLIADEEWMSSPIYPASKEILKSGMILQIDIIPSVSGYAGTSVESGIVLADNELQKDIYRNYPELWNRFIKRRKYVKEVLGINLSDDVLVMANGVGYLRPFLLNKTKAVVYKNQ